MLLLLLVFLGACEGTPGWEWLTGTLSNASAVVAQGQVNHPGGGYHGFLYSYVNTTSHERLLSFNAMCFDVVGNFGGCTQLWEFHIDSRTWEYLGGGLAADQRAVSGPLFHEDPAYHPAGRETDAVAWGEDNLWLFGGSTANGTILHDLWRFNLTSRMWAFMGKNTDQSNPVYGTYRVEDSSNDPGSRLSAAMVHDKRALYLFGGALHTGDKLNDMWRLNLTTMKWTWLHGSSSPNDHGTYGPKGVQDEYFVPQARSHLKDMVALNNAIYIYGGSCFHSQTELLSLPCYLNDLWKFNMTTFMWSLLHGSDSKFEGFHRDMLHFDIVPRHSSSMVALGNGLLVYGGELAGFGFLDDLFYFDPFSLVVTCLIPLSNTTESQGTGRRPSGRINAGIGLILGDTYLFGGAINGSLLGNDVWRLSVCPLGCDECESVSACARCGPATNKRRSDRTACAASCQAFEELESVYDSNHCVPRCYAGEYNSSGACTRCEVEGCAAYVYSRDSECHCGECKDDLVLHTPHYCAPASDTVSIGFWIVVSSFAALVIPLVGVAGWCCRRGFAKRRRLEELEQALLSKEDTSSSKRESTARPELPESGQAMGDRTGTAPFQLQLREASVKYENTNSSHIIRIDPSLLKSLRAVVFPTGLWLEFGRALWEYANRSDVIERHPELPTLAWALLRFVANCLIVPQALTFAVETARGMRTCSSDGQNSKAYVGSSPVSHSKPPNWSSPKTKLSVSNRNRGDDDEDEQDRKRPTPKTSSHDTPPKKSRKPRKRSLLNNDNGSKSPTETPEPELKVATMRNTLLTQLQVPSSPDADNAQTDMINSGKFSDTSQNSNSSGPLPLSDSSGADSPPGLSDSHADFERPRGSPVENPAPTFGSSSTSSAPTSASSRTLSAMPSSASSRTSSAAPTSASSRTSSMSAPLVPPVVAAQIPIEGAVVDRLAGVLNFYSQAEQALQQRESNLDLPATKGEVQEIKEEVAGLRQDMSVVNQLLRSVLSAMAAPPRPVTRTAPAATQRRQVAFEFPKCIVCPDGQRSIVFAGCGHLVCCTGCVEAIFSLPESQWRCPVCRCGFDRDDIIRVFATE